MQTSPARRASTSSRHPLQAPLWEMRLTSDPQEVADGITGLQQLALQGKWREVVTRCRMFTAKDTAVALSVVAFHVLGLAKLRMIAEASAELAKLGDLDDPQYCASKSHGAVSLVPFALRWLQAELPGLAGQVQDSIHAMYGIAYWCQRQQAAVEAAGGTASLATWKERRRRAACSLAAKHVRLRQHRAALAVLNDLLKEEPDQPELWSQAGHVQLSLGDIEAAQQSFERAGAGTHSMHSAQHSGSPQHSAQCQAEGALMDAEACRNQGLLHFVQQDFKGAIGEYSAALRQDPGDHVAANNLAISSMYGGNLTAGIQSLEAAFLAAPDRLLEEGTVLNLASMYDLGASGASRDAKRRMAAWVGANAPDDMDLACTKTALG